MTRFETILARLCAQSGAAYLHIDSLNPAPRALADVIGSDNLTILDEDQEVQMLVSGTPAQAGSKARAMFGEVVSIMTREGIEDANAMVIVGSGAVTRWTGGEPVTKRLPKDVLEAAYGQRDANAGASAG